MKIQVNTDNHIQGSEKLSRQVEATVHAALGRFDDWLTRVEVQLSDESSNSRTRNNDKRCVLEARAAGFRPISASHQGATLDQAIKGCVKKLVRLLSDSKTQMDDRKGNTSYAGDQPN